MIIIIIINLLILCMLHMQMLTHALQYDNLTAQSLNHYNLYNPDY